MPTIGLTDEELRAWQALLHTHEAVTRVLDRELRDEHGISFGEYDVLLRLRREPTHVLRMSDLAERVLMSPSGLTRLVDRLVGKGFVERRDHVDDARVVLVALTDAGRQKLREAARTHVRGIRAHYTSKLSPAQLRNVASALESVAGPHVPH